MDSLPNCFATVAVRCYGRGRQEAEELLSWGFSEEELLPLALLSPQARPSWQALQMVGERQARERSARLRRASRGNGLLRQEVLKQACRRELLSPTLTPGERQERMKVLQRMEQGFQSSSRLLFSLRQGVAARLLTALWEELLQEGYLRPGEWERIRPLLFSLTELFPLYSLEAGGARACLAAFQLEALLLWTPPGDLLPWLLTFTPPLTSPVASWRAASPEEAFWTGGAAYEHLQRYHQMKERYGPLPFSWLFPLVLTDEKE